ncbi:MAG: ATP-dependent DNA helicase DinG, partial [Treponema sp.]|nr:ATP-dependent DNA helicase DinG [Treponema sp.]
MIIYGIQYIVQAGKRFTKEAINQLRSEIEEAGGNEVFALGFYGEPGSEGSNLIERIEVVARGNEGSVLAFHEKSDCSVIIHNHPSGFLTPSDNDLLVSSRAAESGLGSYIVDNPVKLVYVIVEPVKNRQISFLDPESIMSALEPGGVISRRLPEYEIRESQLKLMELIIKGFNKDALVAAEAGTGVGKSFAYLLPALSYADANNERIVISTATITLQEQLYRKDIPLVTAGLKKKIKTVLVKGRGNYLCRRRMIDALKEPMLDDEEMQQTMAIADWAETTRTGSRSDLAFMPVEGLWSRVCSEADNCMGMRCSHREDCFVMLLRKEASDARILVVNHHLLFADLSARSSGAGYGGTVVLPPYDRIILDEAHTVEESATSFFSKEFSRIGLQRQLGRLYRSRRGYKNSLLLRLIPLIQGNIDDDFEDTIARKIELIRSDIFGLEKVALEFCENDGAFRLISQRDEEISERLLPELSSLRKQLNSLAAFVATLLEKVLEDAADDPIVWEIKTVMRRLDTVASVCTSFIDYKSNFDDVMWLERRPGSRADDNRAVFNVTPIDIAPSLKESLFEPNKTIVCVSATLTVGDSFDYWKGRAGLSLLKDREILTGIFPSPFPYSTKVLLAAPHDTPLPTEYEYGAFIDSIVGTLIEIAGGSALILFTSYKALRSAYETSLPILSKLGIRVFKQGDDDRNRLLESFLSD